MLFERLFLMFGADGGRMGEDGAGAGLVGAGLLGVGTLGLLAVDEGEPAKLA